MILIKMPVINAKINFHLNKSLAANSRISLFNKQRSILNDAPYDLIMMNILAEVLIEKHQELLSLTRTGSHIILSGFLEEQRSMIEEAYIDNGFKLVSQSQSNEWWFFFVEEILMRAIYIQDIVNIKDFSNDNLLEVIDKKVIHHFYQVLRIKPLEKVKLLDGKGLEALSKVVAVSKSKLVFKLESQVIKKRESPFRFNTRSAKNVYAKAVFEFFSPIRDK